MTVKVTTKNRRRGRKESGSGKRSICSGKGTEGGTGGGKKPERCAETGTGWCERPA